MRQAPSREQLQFLSQLEVEPSESAMQAAWLGLISAAKAELIQGDSQERLEEEYQELFIGIGRGEVMPFGSWHIAGALMEKPLAELRHDLALLGFERAESVKEPEDHISAICEVLALLSEQDERQQQVMFNKHLAPWHQSLVKQINQAASAQFYLAIAALMDAFFTLEQVRFSDASAHHKQGQKIEVKNIVDTL
ncbi:TorD/DmsD family molecular chaperone [Vibrio sp. WXL210]|uniref:TorD/DmsD family molecular chaperone n=1 Tax=Vibrio sp. WXL210 TaxID=3450709 RepID=UPI003EC6A7B6